LRISDCRIADLGLRIADLIADFISAIFRNPQSAIRNPR